MLHSCVMIVCTSIDIVLLFISSQWNISIHELSLSLIFPKTKFVINNRIAQCSVDIIPDYLVCGSDSTELPRPDRGGENGAEGIQPLIFLNT